MEAGGGDTGADVPVRSLRQGQHDHRAQVAARARAQDVGMQGVRDSDLDEAGAMTLAP